MLRPATRCRIGKKSKRASGNSYEKMMRTLLMQNQQIIIQQQNMMFMVMKQFQPTNQNANSAPSTMSSNHHQDLVLSQQQQNQQPQEQQYNHHQIPQTQSHLIQSAQQAHELAVKHEFSQSQHQMSQEVHLPENLYLTPAASEQDPISDKPEEVDLMALMDGNGLLQNNLLYNPSTDIGPITPYKDHLPQQQTPSYYSSGCESLTTPRVEQQRQPTNISQNVVKNLADSFKSPSKPKINVQIMSDSAAGSMKNSKAKIIRRMNISAFLNHVHHPDSDEKTPSKSISG